MVVVVALAGCGRHVALFYTTNCHCGDPLGAEAGSFTSLFRNLDTVGPVLITRI